MDESGERSLHQLTEILLEPDDTGSNNEENTPLRHIITVYEIIEFKAKLFAVSFLRIYLIAF